MSATLSGWILATGFVVIFFAIRFFCFILPNRRISRGTKLVTFLGCCGLLGAGVWWIS